MSSLPERRPIIRGKQVFLGAAEREDVPLFVRWFNNTDVLRNLSMHAPMSHAGDRRAAARAHQPHRLRGDERAQRSYRKAGFVHEETLRRSHFARVEHHDAHSMSLLREEWTALSHRRSWEYD